MEQGVVAFRDAGRPVAGIAELGCARYAGRVAGRADGLEDFFAGFVHAGGVGVPYVDLRNRGDARGHGCVGEGIGAGAGACRVIDVDGQQDDHDDWNGEPGDYCRNELARRFDRDSVGCFTHARLVSLLFVSRFCKQRDSNNDFLECS